MTLEKFLTLSKAILCLSVAASALIVTPYVVNTRLTSVENTAKVEISNTRKETIQLVDRRFDSLQTNVSNWLGTADKRIGSLEKNTFLLANNLRTDTFGAIGDLRKDTFTAIGDVRKDAFGQIGTLSTSLNGQLTTTNQQVTRLVDAYASIPATVGARFDRQTNCKVNELCWQNMATDLMRDTRYSMNDFSVASKKVTAAMPVFIDSSQKITTNFAGITKNIEYWTHPHWYEKVLKDVAQGAGIYTSIFPPAHAIKGTITTIVQK